MTLTEMQSQTQAWESARTLPRYYQWVKRALDLLICLSSLPVLMVMMGIIAAVIRLDSPGSPIFVQTRIGKAGKSFKIFKFRTLRKDHNGQEDQDFMRAYIAGEYVAGEADQGEPLYKPVKKDKVTRVGRVLRKTSLDELPQIMNVLRGEMSLIGPRPNVPWEVEEYCDWHYERLQVLPGITGLAQVKGRSSLAFDELVNYDIEYVRTQSIRLDLQILWWTALMVVRGDGAG